MSEGLAKARLKLAELKASGQFERLDPVEKAKRNPGSLRLAINAKCWDCCGAGVDGIEFTKTTIRECSSTSCPLHSQRPYQPQEPETPGTEQHKAYTDKLGDIHALSVELGKRS